MKRAVIIFGLTLGLTSFSFAQNISIYMLEHLCGKDWSEAAAYLTNRGWEFFNAEKETPTTYGVVSYSYDRSEYSSTTAKAWIYLYTDNGQVVKIIVAFVKDEFYRNIKNSLSAYGYKKITSKITDDGIAHIYSNSKYNLEIEFLNDKNFAGKNQYSITIKPKTLGY